MSRSRHRYFKVPHESGPWCGLRAAGCWHVVDKDLNKTWHSWKESPMLRKTWPNPAQHVTNPICHVLTDPSMSAVNAGSCSPGSEPCADNPNDVQDAYVPEGGDQGKYHQAGPKDQLQSPAGACQKLAGCCCFIEEHCTHQGCSRSSVSMSDNAPLRRELKRGLTGFISPYC